MGTDVAIFILMVFLAGFFLVTSLVVPTFGTDAKNARAIRKRARTANLEENDESFTLLKNLRSRSQDPLDRLFENFPLFERVRVLLEQAGIKLAAYKYCAIVLVISFVASILVYQFTYFIPFSILAFIAPPLYAWFSLRSRIAKRLNLFEQQLPDAINIIARALRAGHPFNSSLKLVAEEMHDPIATEFKTVASDISFGINTRVALLDMVRRVPSVSLDAVVAAVLVQRETGGNLAEILDKVAAVVRGRFKFARRVKSLSAEGRMSAWVLASVPFVLAGMLAVVEPTYLPFMTKEPAGRQLILIGFVMIILGILWMKKIIKIEV